MDQSGSMLSEDLAKQVINPYWPVHGRQFPDWTLTPKPRGSLGSPVSGASLVTDYNNKLFSGLCSLVCGNTDIKL